MVKINDLLVTIDFPDNTSFEYTGMDTAEYILSVYTNTDVPALNNNNYTYYEISVKDQNESKLRFYNFSYRLDNLEGYALNGYPFVVDMSNNKIVGWHKNYNKIFYNPVLPFSIVENSNSYYGTINDINTFISSNSVSSLGNLTISDISVNANELSTLGSNTTATIDATSVTTITGTISDINTVYDSSNINSLDITYAIITDTTVNLDQINTFLTSKSVNSLGNLTISDISVNANNLNTLDSNTTGIIDVSSITTIIGTTPDINTVYASSGISGLNITYITITDTSLNANELNTLDTNTTGIIDASSVTTITGTISDINTVYTSSDISGLNITYITITDTSLNANDLNTLDGNTTATIDTTLVTNITGDISNINIVHESLTLTLIGNNNYNEDITINGTIIVDSQSIIHFNSLVVNNCNESFNNYGITYINNTFTNNGTVRNYGTLYIYGTFNNTTNAKILNYGTIKNYGTFTNAGTFNSSSGTFTIISPGRFINTGSYISKSDSNLLTFIASNQISNRMIKKNILKSNNSNSGTGSCGSASASGGCN